MQAAKGWALGAFIGGTLDALFKTQELNKGSKILGSMAALLQVSVGSYALYTLTYPGYDNDDSRMTAVMGPYALFEMSPQAIMVLKENYKSFHILLYGRAPVEASCCSDCSTQTDPAACGGCSSDAYVPK